MAIAAMSLPCNSQDKTPLASLIIKRVSVENFLEDVLVRGSAISEEQGSNILRSIFVLSSPTTEQSIYWSPLACRLLAVKNEKGANPNSIEMNAEGAHPLGISIGTVGKPKYFGFRLVDGAPEFLYTFGQLSVEERLELSSDGKKLIQSFKVTANAANGSFSLPKKWRDLATANNGKWSNNVLSLSKTEMAEGFAFTFHLDPDKPKTTASSGQ